MLLHIAGNARMPLAKPLLHQAKPSTTVLHEGQSDTMGQHPPTKDAASTSMDADKKAETLPKESRQQSDKLQEAEQPHAASAHLAADSHSQPAAETHESVLDFASHPTAVDTVRRFVKNQVRWFLDSIRQSFTSSNKNDSSASQPDKQAQQRTANDSN